MATQPTSRTVKPAGETITRLRLQKGWTVEEMAAKASLTPKTVMRVESSTPCYLFTITACSQALGLPDNCLLLAETAPAPKPARDGPRIQLKLRFVLPFTDFDFTEQLVKIIEFLIRLIDPSGDIEVVGVAPGSVIVTLEMGLKDGQKLVSALGVGELDALNISSITADFGGGCPIEFASPPRASSIVEPARPAPKQEHKSSQTKSSPSLFKRICDWFTQDSDQGGSQPSYKDKSYREEGSSIFDRFKQRR